MIRSRSNSGASSREYPRRTIRRTRWCRPLSCSRRHQVDHRRGRAVPHRTPSRATTRPGADHGAVHRHRRFHPPRSRTRRPCWRELLERHDEITREEIARFQGREVKHTGDGFLATFDGPTRAVRCATTLAERMPEIGIDVRGGLHTGECELRGDDIGGIAVHIGARVAALARAGEVLVSSTVKDLVNGSGISFQDRGAHVAEGHTWRVEAVRSGRRARSDGEPASSSSGASSGFPGRPPGRPHPSYSHAGADGPQGLIDEARQRINLAAWRVRNCSPLRC